MKLLQKQKTKVIAVGIGYSGGCVISHIVNDTLLDINTICIGTDKESLLTKSGTTILIGEKLTKGFGTKLEPKIGEAAALESYNLIKEALMGAGIVFIFATLGGGTGSGASPVVVRIVKEIGALSIVLVTKPFQFEGKKRLKIANESYMRLKEESDVIIYPSKKFLFSFINKHDGLKDSFKTVASLLIKPIYTILGVINSNNINNIAFNILKLKNFMLNKGVFSMGIGEGTRDDAVNEAMKNAIKSLQLNNFSIKNTTSMLVHFQMHTDFALENIHKVMNLIKTEKLEKKDVIIYTDTDKFVEKNSIKITIIATDYRREDFPEPLESVGDNSRHHTVQYGISNDILKVV